MGRARRATLSIDFTTTAQVKVEAYVISTDSRDTRFDDLKIEIIDRPTAVVIQENHYYPFGLSMKGLDYTAPSPNRENKFQFNGVERNTSLNLNVIETQFRMGDTQIGRWWQIDPKPNYGESVYAMMGNNPMRYADPRGDTIRFSFRDGFLGLFGKKHNVVYNNGNLTENGQAYTGKRSRFARKTVEALDRVRTGGQHGRHLVETLQNTSISVNIVKGTNGYNRSDDGNNVYVSWKPDNTSSGLDQNGNTSRPSYIGLGHELAHAYDWVSDRRVDMSVWYTLNNGSKVVRRAEIFATHYENLLRSENNLPLRTHYGLVMNNDDNTVAGANGLIIVPNTRMNANINIINRGILQQPPWFNPLPIPFIY